MTDKEIQSLFDKLNPNAVQKEKAWKEINKKKGTTVKSTRKFFMIAAIISTAVIISVFTINAISGGSILNNINKSIFGEKTAHAKAVTYNSKNKNKPVLTTSNKKSVSRKAQKRKQIRKNKKGKKRKSRKNNKTLNSAESISITPKPVENKLIPNDDSSRQSVTNNSPSQEKSESVNPCEIESGNYIYLPLTKNTASLVEYTGKESKVTIPSEIGIYKIVTIDESAFICNNKINEVTIPEGVKTINTRAFYGCKNLTSVSLPGTLLSIGERAFRATLINSIEIPENVETIKKGAFANCKKLADVKIGTGIKSIELNAFNASDILTIYGYKGTAAYDYALSQGISFVDINEN